MDTFTLLVFFLASLILLIGFAGQIIFRRTNIPDVIWLILFGILLSFFLTPSQKDLLVSFAGPFGALALIMILFNSGMGFDIIEFSQGIPKGIALSLVNFIATAILTAFLSNWIFGWPLLYGLLLGIAVGGTSSGVIVPIVTRLKVSDRLKYILTVESTATDIFVIVFAIAVIDIIKTGTTDLFVAAQSITAAFSVGITVGAISGLIWLFIVRRIEREIRLYLLDLTVVLLVYVFTEFIHGSGAIAALMFGMIMGNVSTLRKIVKLPEGVSLKLGEKVFYSELNFFIRTFFFVYLGLLLNFKDPYLVVFGLVLTMFYLAVRIIVARGVFFRSGMPELEKNLAGVMMARGLAAAVIAQAPMLALPSSVPYYEVFKGFSSIVLSVILFSIIATVFGVAYFLRSGEGSSTGSIGGSTSGSGHVKKAQKVGKGEKAEG